MTTYWKHQNIIFPNHKFHNISLLTTTKFYIVAKIQVKMAKKNIHNVNTQKRNK